MPGIGPGFFVHGSSFNEKSMGMFVLMSAARTSPTSGDVRDAVAIGV